MTYPVREFPFAHTGDYPPLWCEYPALAGADPLAQQALAPLAEALGGVADIQALAQRVRRRRAPEASRRAKLVEALRAYHATLGPVPAAVAANLERLANPATVTVVTGQQPALLGGPGYVLSKALTTVALAAALTREGVEAVPLFWIASEDHDLSEANTVWLPGRLDDPADQAHWQAQTAHGGLARLHAASGFQRGRPLRRTGLATRRGTTRVPLEQLHLSAEEATTLNAWLAPLETPLVKPQDTLGGWQARSLLGELGKLGLVIVEPWLLRPLQGELVAEALAQHARLAEEVARQAAAWAHAVPALAEFAEPHPHPPLFYLTTTAQRDVHGNPVQERRHLVATASGYTLEGAAPTAEDPLLKAGAQTVAQWQAFARAHPERFSVGALLRPVLQDALLDCVAYAAGPAELAYNLLSRQWHSTLGVEPAALVRRLSATVLPASRLKAAAEALSRRAAARQAVAALSFDRPESEASVHRELLDEVEAALGEVAAHGGPVLGAMRATAEGLTHKLPRRLRRHVNRSAEAPQAFATEFPPALDAALRYFEPAPRHLQERTVPWLALERNTLVEALAGLNPLHREHLLVGTSE